MMRLLAALTLLLCLTGCSSLLFYPEPGLPFTPERAKLEYRDITLTTADGLKLHGWWLPAKAGVEVKGTVSAETVEVKGKLDGKVSCESFTLRASSEVKADVNTTSLVIESGATIEGRFLKPKT